MKEESIRQEKEGGGTLGVSRKVLESMCIKEQIHSNNLHSQRFLKLMIVLFQFPTRRARDVQLVVGERERANLVVHLAAAHTALAVCFPVMFIVTSLVPCLTLSVCPTCLVPVAFCCSVFIFSPCLFFTSLRALSYISVRLTSTYG